MAHVAKYKKKVVAKLEKLINDYPIIGAINMENLPTPQLQTMRAQLRGKAQLVMTKRRLIKIAINNCKGKKEGIEKLERYLKGMPALIFTKKNPFVLFKTLKRSKSSAPAKAGQTAPKDILVKAGPTSFAPGPIIGELSSIGIKCGIDGGKVAIKEDSVVVEEGEKIGAKKAEILTRLGIEPMEVGLDLIATYENGTIFVKDVLDIDEVEFKNKFENAARWAVNLAVYSAYPTKDTIKLLIVRSFSDAKTIGLERNIIDEGIIDGLLGKAESQMENLKRIAGIQATEKEGEIKRKELSKEEAEEPKKEVSKEVKIEQLKGESKVKEERKKEEVKDTPKIKEKREQQDDEGVIDKPKGYVKEIPKEEIKAEAIKVEEKKEVLEEEKKIIEEEEKLEKKEEITGTPVEKEVKETVKEEEEKQLEKERIEKEKEFEKLEKGDETDKKVAEMVKKMKEYSTGKEEPTAEKIVEEIKKEEQKEVEKEKEEVLSAHDLAKQKKKEHAKAEQLARELIKKGTLRR